MADLYSFKSNFDPILLPGETAQLITSSKTVNVECLAVGALPEYMKDFGSLSATTWDRDNEDANLEMPGNEFAQFRMRIIDDVKMELNNLGSTKQWRTSKTNFYLRQFPKEPGQSWLQEWMWKASEFFVYEDDTPRFDFYSDIALSNSRVLFSGWRYKTRPIGVKGKITVWVSGWASGGA